MSERNRRSPFYPRNVAEQESRKLPPWLMANGVPGHGKIVAYGPFACEFAPNLCAAFARVNRRVMLVDARDTTRDFWSRYRQPSWPVVFVLPLSTPHGMARYLLDEADCILRPSSATAAEVMKLRDGPEPEGKMIRLRRFAE
jgi:hypothetical protein